MHAEGGPRRFEWMKKFFTTSYMEPSGYHFMVYQILCWIHLKVEGLMQKTKDHSNN